MIIGFRGGKRSGGLRVMAGNRALDHIMLNILNRYAEVEATMTKIMAQNRLRRRELRRSVRKHVANETFQFSLSRSRSWRAEHLIFLC